MAAGARQPSFGGAHAAVAVLGVLRPALRQRRHALLANEDIRLARRSLQEERLRRWSRECVQRSRGTGNPEAARRPSTRMHGARFPLEADPEKAKAYCNENVNAQGDPPVGSELPTIGDSYFENWGSYVYMCVITHSNVDSIPYSIGNNIGPTAREQVIFYLPVKWYRRGVVGNNGPAHPKDPTLRLYKLGSSSFRIWRRTPGHIGARGKRTVFDLHGARGWPRRMAQHVQGKRAQRSRAAHFSADHGSRRGAARRGHGSRGGLGAGSRTARAGKRCEEPQ